MEYRRLGKTGWQVSTISMGCWGIGGQWGPVEEAEAIRTIHAALDLGVNLFDTADAYGSGVSEELVGKALRGRRDDVYIATKVGNFGRRQDVPLSYTSPLHIYLCCDASLGRMKLDTIDLYQCHIGDLPDPSIFLEAFERLVEQGKIRAYGISTNSLAVAQAFNRDGELRGGAAQLQPAQPRGGARPAALVRRERHRHAAARADRAGGAGREVHAGVALRRHRARRLERRAPGASSSCSAWSRSSRSASWSAPIARWRRRR